MEDLTASAAALQHRRKATFVCRRCAADELTSGMPQITSPGRNGSLAWLLLCERGLASSPTLLTLPKLCMVCLCFFCCFFLCVGGYGCISVCVCAFMHVFVSVCVCLW